MTEGGPHYCVECTLLIQPPQRWVREKVYGSDRNGVAPAYRYFHAEPFVGMTASCHEKFLREKLADCT